MIGIEFDCGKGIGIFAVNTMLIYTFRNMNLRRIELGVLANNKRAINLYDKIGFKIEGVKRQAVFKNGEYIDLIDCAILRDEYSPPWSWCVLKCYFLFFCFD